MGVPWFMASPDRWDGDSIRLGRDESHHAVDVLKVSPPDIITVTDGAGRVARCAVRGVVDGRVEADVLEVDEARRLTPEIAVYQGVAKGRKLDETVEKLAEMGVGEFWAYSSRRSVAEWDKHKVEKVTTRWRAISRAATKQARSAFATNVGGVLSWTELVRRLAKEEYSVVLWEEASLPLRTALVGGATRIALVVGPEGGLAREEAEALADCGAQLVSLGPRIFRTENASIVGAASLLYHYGLIG
ncbi:MAG: 16S rRNA (uracil(1498)-N(3))-methyltransferase [Actinomycetota bacterium]|nr:16S rRNA (uracil(1498)-N(3))-methyltransferase [Actinomycetota bacterium]